MGIDLTALLPKATGVDNYIKCSRVGGPARAGTAAKEWTRRFLDLHVKHFPGWDGEVEIREMMDQPPPTGTVETGGLSR